MSRSRWRPVRNATSSTVGIGKRPCTASAEATIMASVADGSSTSASADPTSGTIDASDMAAMVMKNSAAMAMGWRQNTRMPLLTQSMPVRAGTMWSFMAVWYRVGRRAGQSVTGCATRWRSTRSKWRGSCGVSMEASRGR